MLRMLRRSHPIDLVPTFLGAHAVPPEYKGNRSLRRPRHRDPSRDTTASLAEFVDVFCDAGAFTVDETERIRAAAREQVLASNPRRRFGVDGRDRTGAGWSRIAITCSRSRMKV